jgi:4-amino-4-deoxy-L-arabinose transferase-like glycosyltransferase
MQQHSSDTPLICCSEPACAWRLVAQCVLIFAIAMTARLAFHKPAPHFDELYHLMAARSWLAQGDFVIHEGRWPYVRGKDFTWQVVASFWLLGESLWAARVPAMIWGALMVVLLFAWLRCKVGAVAAWLGAAMLAFCPEALDNSAFGRFYTMHAVMVMLMAASAYALVHSASTLGRAALLAAATAIFAGLAFRLQEITVIVVLAVGAWVGPWGVWRLERRPLVRRGFVVALTLILSLLVALGLWHSGFGQRLLARFHTYPLWAMGYVDDSYFYVRYLWEWYKPLMLATPLLTAAALWRHPRPAGFLLVVALVGLAVHSFAASKELRYAFWVMPFLLGLWAIGGAVVLTGLHAMAMLVAARVTPLTPAWRRAAGITAAVTLGAAVLYSSQRTWAYIVARNLIVGSPAQSPFNHPDWATPRDRLRELTQTHDVVLVSATMKGAYYLDRVNFAVSISEREGRAEFTPDPRTGIDVIAEPASLERLMAEHPSGLLVIEWWHWRSPWVVTDAMSDLIEQRTEFLPEFEPNGLRVYRWGSTAP